MYFYLIIANVYEYGFVKLKKKTLQNLFNFKLIMFLGV